MSCLPVPNPCNHIAPGASVSANPSNLLRLAIVIIAALASHVAQAQTTYTWAPGGVQDAAGTWNTTTTNWNAGVVWPNSTSPGDVAQFGLASVTRTVTVSGTINADSLLFTNLGTGGWTFSGGTLNLVGSGQINPNNGNNTVRIDSSISGSVGLTLDTTSGTRGENSETRLTGSNNYTGTTTVRDSTLTLYNADALGATGSGNGTVLEASGRLGYYNNSTTTYAAEDITIQHSGSAVRFANGNSTLSGNLLLNRTTANGANQVGLDVRDNDRTVTWNGNMTTTSSDNTQTSAQILLSTASRTSSKIIVNGVISNGLRADLTAMTTRLVFTGDTAGTSGTELNGNNTFTGEVTIRGGSVWLGHDNALGTSANGVNFGDGGGGGGNTMSLLTTGAYTIADTISFNNASSVAYTAIVGGNHTSGTSTYSGGIGWSDDAASTYRLTAAAGGTVVFSGLINDGTRTKALSKVGAGAVVLSRADGNTFDGGMTLSEGTLLAGANTSFGTGTLALNAGTIGSSSSSARTFANALTIGGDITFGQTSGGTGELNFSSTATNSLGGATRALTANVNTTLGGALGNGNLTKEGSANLILSNSSSSFGTLTINAGSVVLTNNAVITGLGGSGGLALNSSTLTVENSGAQSFGGAISGSGNLTKSGAGTLVLSGANNYTGGTLLSAGTLKGDTTSLQGAITNSAAAIFDTATNGTYAGVMSGTGTLAKTGAGTLTLTVTNTYNGATTVETGKLVVDGAISNSAVTVQSNAVLGGSGIVGATAVLNGATIAPGNSPGTLTINGDLTWNNGGGYDWEVFRLPTAGVAGTDWDLLSVTGSLDLTNLTGAPLFNINLYSLSGTNSAGPLADWSPTGTYKWKILESGNAIDTSYFSYIGINTTQFSAYNDIGGGLFALELLDGGKGLYLTYTGGEAIPEPGTWAAAALLAGCTGFLRWRKRRRA